MKKIALVPKETLMMALDNVRAHKFRSFLTVLGIVVGVATVIAVASILTGLRSNLIRYVEDFGVNNIYAFHLSTGIQMGRDRSERSRKPLTDEDAEAIQLQAPAVEAVSKQLWMWLSSREERTIAYGNTKYAQGQISSVSANYADVTNMGISEGRFFNEIDDQHRREVMVIGPQVAEALFPNQSRVVGSQVTFYGKIFEIVGVLEKRKVAFFTGESEEDNAVFIPYRTGRKMSPRSEWIMFNIRSKSGMIHQALDQVEEILRRQREVKYNEPNNFDLNTVDKLIKQFDSIFAMVGLIAIAISGIGLLVGGIGVMNIMLVSVTERTQEIGVRKAIGARAKDIVRQFLFEAMTLTFLGGILGVALAVGASYLIMLIFPSLPASIPMWAVTTGLTVSVAIGLVFGVWPARKAARLDPIEALRYE
ncbi:MAG TPA: ABC transporter permease [Blastocatellia bacterium]|nr:ABC transporter permease [Blastocatellia bacterium]